MPINQVYLWWITNGVEHMLITCLACGWIDVGQQIVCIHCGNGFGVMRNCLTTIGGLRLASADGCYAWLLPEAHAVTIGRFDPHRQFSVDVDLSIAGALEYGVGRTHARLFVGDGRVWLEDLQSSNGSRINGRWVDPTEPMPLYFGSMFYLGQMSLVFDVA